MELEGRREWPRRIASMAGGWLRLAAWAAVLWAVAAPWTGLGGLVDERLRWFERAALWGGLWAGLTVGGFARDACRPGRAWTHARWLRPLVWPAVGLAAVGLVACECGGQEDVGAVWLTLMLAWCAGLDTALAAWPLASGRDYRFAAAVDVADASADPDEATRRAIF
jgi:hypothetical protein